MTRTTSLLLTLHGLGILLLLALLAFAPSPLHTNLVRWDATWYESIKASGYFYKPTGYSSVAFFPLFPLVWHVTHLEALGISLVNLAIGLAAIYLLYRQLHLRPVAVLLFMALPSSIFLCLPYTEALFFLFSSVVLLALARRYQPLLVLAGALLLGSFTRITALFMLPAFVVVEGLAGWRMPSTYWERVQRLALLGTIVVLGTALVIVYQWYATGVWLAFFKAEGQWHHELQAPHFPLTSNGNDTVLLLDGLALLVGLGAGLWALRTVVQVVRGRQAEFNPLVLFSAVYLFTTTVNAVATAPVTLAHQSSLLSLQRYIFTTPFFLVLLNQFLPRQLPTLSQVAGLLGGVLLTAAALGMLSTATFELKVLRLAIPGLLYTLLMLGYVALWLLAPTRWGWLLLYGISLGLQVFFLYTYSTGNWVA